MNCRVFFVILGILVFRMPLFAQSEAVTGMPIGVGCVVLNISQEEAAQGLGLDGIMIFEQNNRVLYPVVEQRTVPPAVTNTFQNTQRPVGRLVGNILGQISPSVAIYFLFDGKPEPLRIRATTAHGTQLTLVPRHAPLRFRQLLGEWWDKYNKNANRATNDQPPVVSEYLRNMLSYRLGLQRPENEPSFLQKLVYEETGFQLNPDTKLFDAQRSLFFDSKQFLFPADQPLPVSLGDLIKQQTGPTSVVPVATSGEEQEEEQGEEQGEKREEEQGEGSPQKSSSLWSTLTRKFSAAISDNKKVQPVEEQEIEGIESLAFHVPSHCFYIRFGSFTNFLWFQDTVELWGGDMRNLIALQTIKNSSNDRFEKELVVKRDTLSNLFGSSVIDDIAVIGTDLYFDEGGSFGLLFKAKNNQLLALDFQQKRKDAMKADKTIEEKILKMDGQTVSFLTTPDNHVRSFYVVMGNYHLISRSEQLVRDFIALHAKTEGIRVKVPSLGELAEFHRIREIMPPQQDNTIFLYFSRPYFYNLTSPPYWIESRRRNLAAAGIELLQLGSLAATGEGLTSSNLPSNLPNLNDQWVAMLRHQGFIPRNFGPLPDGSRTVFRSWSDVSDSVRGHRGTFLPIADNLVTKVTVEETRLYQQMCREFFSDWGNLDPLAVSLQHVPQESPEGKMERITIDVRMAPLSTKNGKTLRQRIGKPMYQKLAPVEGNIASFELALQDQFFFGGMQNSIPTPMSGERPKLLEQITSAALFQGELFPRDLVSGYMGLSGSPGTLLQLMDLGFPPQNDAAGYSQNVVGGWRRHFGPFTLYSQDRSLLGRVSPQLTFVPAEMPAQFRLEIQDPTNSKIAPILNNLGFARTRSTSKGNTLFLNQLHVQLHVSGPECKKVAEKLLGNEMVCPLGGMYEFRPLKPEGVQGLWTSTALDQTKDEGLFATKAPDGFVSPPLNWFRGTKAAALVASDAVSVHAEVQMLLPQVHDQQGNDKQENDRSEKPTGRMTVLHQ